MQFWQKKKTNKQTKSYVFANASIIAQCVCVFTEDKCMHDPSGIINDITAVLKKTDV